MDQAATVCFREFFQKLDEKSFYQNIKIAYSRYSVPKRVTSGGAHLHCLAPGQHSSEETSLRWRAVDDSMFNFTVPRIEPQTSCADMHVFSRYANLLVILQHFNEQIWV